MVDQQLVPSPRVEAAEMWQLLKQRIRGTARHTVTNERSGRRRATAPGCLPAADHRSYRGVRSWASTIRMKGIFAVSLTSRTSEAFEASKRHIQCASPGTNVLRM